MIVCELFLLFFLLYFFHLIVCYISDWLSISLLLWLLLLLLGGGVYTVPAPSAVFFPETEVPLQVARQQRSSRARSCDTCRRLWLKANVSSGRARVAWVGRVLPSSLVHSKHYGGRGFPVLEWRRAGQQRRIPGRGEQQRTRRAERQRQRRGRAGPGHLRVQHLFGDCQGRCHQYVRPLVLVRGEAKRGGVGGLDIMCGDGGCCCWSAHRTGV